MFFFALSLLVRYSYMSNLTIFTCNCYFAIFSRTCQFQCCLTPNIFSAIPFENMRSWLSLFVFYDLFILGHLHMFSWILLSTLQLQLSWVQVGNVSAESFGRSITVLQLCFPPALSTYKLRQFLAQKLYFVKKFRIILQICQGPLISYRN